jgi:2-hydroxychromene-2-carboxylate isomerase
MEQALFGMRLSNKKYIDQLEIEGRKRRLDNAVQFKEALTETLFKEELDLLKSDIAFKRKLAGDEREFAALLESIDLDTALKLVMQESEATQIAMVAQGAKDVISGGLKYASRKEEE